MKKQGIKLAAAEVTREQYGKVSELAEKQQRTVSSLIRHLFKLEIEKDGGVW